MVWVVESLCECSFSQMILPFENPTKPSDSGQPLLHSLDRDDITLTIA
jgi:hypothetical protein